MIPYLLVKSYGFPLSLYPAHPATPSIPVPSRSFGSHNQSQHHHEQTRANLLLLVLAILRISILNFCSVCMYHVSCHVFLPKQQICIYLPKLKIMTRNLQNMILGVPQGHPWCQGWPCPPCLRSGTLNVIQVPPFLTLNLYQIPKLNKNDDSSNLF